MQRSLVPLLFGVVIAWAAPARAQGVPGSVSFTARLVDNGNPVNGARTFELKVFDVETGGTEIWTETHTGIMVSQGLAYLEMGSVSALDPFTFDGGKRWLQITVNGTAMSPRLPIVSVPYAIRAGLASDSEALGGLAASDYVTGVSAGTGLSGGGSSGDFTVSADTTYLQRRVGSCASGNAIISIAADGTPTCGALGTGDITSVGAAPGGGLTGGATAGDASLGLIACMPGEILKYTTVGWGCVADAVGDMTGVLTASGSGLTGGASSGDATLALISCAVGDTLVYGSTGWTCGVSGDIGGITTASGSGLTGGVTSGTANLSLMACSAGQVLRYNGTQWVCASDLNLLTYGRTTSNPGNSCADIKNVAPWSEDGIYLVDPDDGGPIGTFRVRCDMTRDGGGWTLVLKNRYGSGMHGRTDGFGTVDDLDYHQADFYKLSDTIINAIIADGTFDILADQVGYNSYYSNGNHEFVLIRNYTATFTFGALVPESSTTTVFESYRASDNLLLWRGRLGCGYAGGVGINCYPVLSTPSPIGAANPQGGAGCLYPLGYSSSTGWHHFFMSETNTDTYLYICNGAQHTSSYDLSHQWWVR